GAAQVAGSARRGALSDAPRAPLLAAGRQPDGARRGRRVARRAGRLDVKRGAARRTEGKEPPERRSARRAEAPPGRGESSVTLTSADVPRVLRPHRQPLPRATGGAREAASHGFGPSASFFTRGLATPDAHRF